MATKPNVSSIKRTGRLITALVVLTMLAMIGWTVWFLYRTLESVSAPGESGQSAAAGTEELNMELLNKVEQTAAAKVSQPIPKPEDVHNPFMMPAAPTQPAPPETPTAPPETSPVPEKPVQEPAI